MLPSYILAGALKQTKYYLDIGRVDRPYVWFILYKKSTQKDTYCLFHDRDLYSVALTMLAWLDRHKEEFDVGY